MSHRKRVTNNRAKKLTRRRQLQRVKASNKASLSLLQNWLLPSERIFSQLKFHGNTTWLPRSLVWLALFWAWSECRHLTDAFAEAAGYCQKWVAGSPLRSFTGFMDAMTTWTASFMEVLCPELQARMQEIGGRFWQIGKWVPIAFDGSRETTPRTQANEQAFCAPNYGQGKTAQYRKKKTKGLRRRKNEREKPQPQRPQAWITMLWHMRLRLPWMWRLGPSNSSEREHVMQMLETGRFPKNTLFGGDAGFVGHPLWSAIRRRGHHFLVRVGANVSLLREHSAYTLEENGEVLCWPQEAQRSHEPPLRLRLVQAKIGKTKMWLLTSVLDEDELTLSEIVEFYKMRWGIEVEFRGLKQTLNRALLRSRNDQRLLAELEWSILAMAVAELLALKEQLDRRGLKRNTYTPLKRSLANTIRALRKCLRHLDEIPDPGEDLQTLLREAVTDDYVRTSSKKSRHRPPNPDKKPLGDPKLRPPTPQEQEKLDAMTKKKAA